MAHGSILDSMKGPSTAGKPVAFYLSVAKKWSPQIASYGAFAGIMFLYMTDWKVFMDKVPFYNTKFQEKETIV